MVCEATTICEEQICTYVSWCTSSSVLGLSWFLVRYSSVTNSSYNLWRSTLLQFVDACCIVAEPNVAILFLSSSRLVERMVGWNNDTYISLNNNKTVLFSFSHTWNKFMSSACQVTKRAFCENRICKICRGSYWQQFKI